MEAPSSTVEAQTKMRGFLVTGREGFLDHFDEIEENAKFILIK
jgi:CHASE3 domain sensor protein